MTSNSKQYASDNEQYKSYTHYMVASKHKHQASKSDTVVQYIEANPYLALHLQVIMNDILSEFSITCQMARSKLIR
jgi:hypothetical protein